MLLWGWKNFETVDTRKESKETGIEQRTYGLSLRYSAGVSGCLVLSLRRSIAYTSERRIKMLCLRNYQNITDALSEQTDWKYRGPVQMHLKTIWWVWFGFAFYWVVYSIFYFYIHWTLLTVFHTDMCPDSFAFSSTQQISCMFQCWLISTDSL